MIKEVNLARRHSHPKCVPNNQGMKHVKQTQVELIGEKDKSTITQVDMSISLSQQLKDRKLKSIQEFNNSINH